MVTGNAGIRKDERTCEVKKFKRNFGQTMEFPDSSGDNKVGFLPHSEGASTAHSISSKDPAEIMELRAPVKISWNHGGNQVALIGSWDNWETREIMQRMDTRFQVLKTLPSGIYHYRFVVDGWLVCAPDLPWVSDDSGNPYNILDLPQSESEMLESLSEFECPPSPESSYDNQILNEDDFSKPPPELPPQLRTTVLNGKSPSDDHSGPSPVHTDLNHLYVQSNHEGQFMALGSTHRFSQKYISMLLYKPFSSRTS